MADGQAASEPVHFYRNAARTACMNGTERVNGEQAPVVKLPALVTCKSCKRTQLFKDAARRAMS